MDGNHVENNATLWANLQNYKISSRVEIPKLDPSVAITKTISDTNLTDAISCNPYFVLIFSRFISFQPRF